MAGRNLGVVVTAFALFSSILSGFGFVGGPGGSVRGILYDLGSYPGVVLDEKSGGLVRGSVFELPRDDPSLLTRIDAYEGFDQSDCERSLFIRKRSVVQLTDRTVLPCWVYTYNRSISGAALVPDGDYVRWRSERNRLF